MHLESRSLKSNFIRYVIPSILAQWVYALYNMVDGFFVAWGVGEVALTAVNLSNPFLQFLFATSVLFAVGTSTVTAIFMGNGEYRRASEVFTQNIVTQLVLGVAIIALMVPNLEAAAIFLGAKDPETLGYVKEYLIAVIPFAPAFLLSYTFEVLLKTDGFPRKTVCIVIFCAVENCILDWLFVIVMHKGVGGAAFATGFSQMTGTIIYLYHFLKKKGTFRFSKFHFSPGLMVREVRNGFSSSLTEISAGVVTLIFNRVILLYLTRDALVSYAIVSYINGLIVFSIIGIVQGSQPLISYYYGKREEKICRKLLHYCLRTSVAFCVGALMICAMLTYPIVSCYVGEDLSELRAYSVMVVRIFILSFPLMGLNITLSGYLASVEYPTPAVVISAARGFVVLLASLFLLTSIWGGTGIWWAPLLSEVVSAGIAFVLFRNCWGKVFSRDVL